VYILYTPSQWSGLSAPLTPCHIHRGCSICLGPWGQSVFHWSHQVRTVFGWNVHSSYVESCQQPTDPVTSVLHKGYSEHPGWLLPLWICPLLGDEGLVDVYFAVTILSESVLEMLDFSIKAFRVTNDPGRSGEGRKNILWWVIDCVMTGITDHLTPPTVPTGSLVDKDTRLEEPVVGRNTAGSHATHHIYPDDGDRFTETFGFNSIRLIAWEDFIAR
jgi:hypothetical protein